MKKINVILLSVFTFFAFALSAQPSNAVPGKCYAKCMVPQKTETMSVPITIKEASMKVQIKNATFTDASDKMLVQEESKTFSALNAKFEKESTRVLTKDAYKVLKVVPAKFETRTEKILVKEAYKVAKVVPATYKTETFQEMVKPGYTTYEKKPAQFREEQQTIEIAPKSQKWVQKRDSKNCLGTNPDDCMVWCFVETPAEYKNVTKKILVGCGDGWEIKGDDCIKAKKVDPVYKTYTKKVVATPARVDYTEVPAQYKERTFQKLVSEATVVEELVPAAYTDFSFESVKTDASATETIVPAQYETRTFQRLGSEASLIETTIPAESITIQKTNIVTQGGFVEDWREVVCESDITPRLIAQVQKALIDRGYNVGPAGIDNILGEDTKAALKKFQQDKGLPQGSLDFETLKALGIKQ